MTLLALALLLAGAVAAPLILMLLIPAVTRPLYANRMYRLAAELEDHFDSGDVRVEPFTTELLETLYHLGHYPQDASFLVFLRPAPPINNVRRRRADFERTATLYERTLVKRILWDMAKLTSQQMMRNSILWLPAWCAYRIAKKMRLAKRSKDLDAIRGKVIPTPTQVVNVFADAPREHALASI